MFDKIFLSDNTEAIKMVQNYNNKSVLFLVITNKTLIHSEGLRCFSLFAIKSTSSH